jgi:hypothetical protein
MRESESVDLTIHRSKASGPLMPTTVATWLERRGKTTHGRVPQAAIAGRHLRVALDLRVEDDACAAFAVSFEGQAGRLRGTARGPSTALLEWAFHALAALLGATLDDSRSARPVTPSPETYLPKAVAYLEEYELAVAEAREALKKNEPSDATSGARFFAWLADEEQIAVAEGTSAETIAALATTLPMEDASALYEMLLESDFVDDVFVSETELEALLTRFRARTERRA